TSTRPDPIFSCATKECQRNSCSNRGVTDTHFTYAEKICATSNAFHAECHSRRTGAFVHCRFFGDISGRMLQCKVKDLKTEIVSNAYLVDRCTACCKILNHLCSHA